MHFASFSDFYGHGGYAFYVWLSFGLTGLCLAGLVISTRLKTRSLLGELRNKAGAGGFAESRPSRWRTPEPAPQRKRLTIILAISLGLASVIGLALCCPWARTSTSSYTPSELVEGKGRTRSSPRRGSACASRRPGGAGSVERDPQSLRSLSKLVDNGGLHGEGGV